MAARQGQTIREAFEYVAIAEREAQDMIAGLARMQGHAGLALTVGDCLDVLRLASTIIDRTQLVIEAVAARIDTLDHCAQEPDEALTHVAGVAR